MGLYQNKVIDYRIGNMIKHTTIVALLLFSASAFGQVSMQPGEVDGLSHCYLGLSYESGKSPLLIAGSLLDKQLSKCLNLQTGLEYFDDGMSLRGLSIPVYCNLNIELSSVVNTCFFAGFNAATWSYILPNWRIGGQDLGFGADFRLSLQLTTYLFAGLSYENQSYIFANWSEALYFGMGAQYKCRRLTPFVELTPARTENGLGIQINAGIRFKT